jgi:hypothetical protein
MQPESPISIELAKAKFDEWRATRRTRTSKIPEILWDIVKPLYPHYTLAQISTTLGLSYSQLKPQLCIPTSQFPLEDPPLFAKCTLPSIPQTVEAKKDCSLEFSSPKGMTLKINGLSSDSLISLTSLLLKNAP